MVKSNQELQSKHGPLAEPLPRQLYMTVTATLAHPTRQVPFQTRTLKRRIGRRPAVLPGLERDPRSVD